jgi:hypothetical protein
MRTEHVTLCRLRRVFNFGLDVIRWDCIQWERQTYSLVISIISPPPKRTIKKRELWSKEWFAKRKSYFLPYFVHIYVQMSLFHVKTRLPHWYTLTPLHSHSYTPTCFSPQGTILGEYWYILWAGQHSTCPDVNIILKGDNCHVTNTYNTLLFNLILTSGHVFCWPCSRNVSVLPEDGPLRAETCRTVTVWIKLC